MGLACLPDHALRPFLAEGRLQQCWRTGARYHLYYPSRRQNSPRSLSWSKRSAGEDSPAGPTTSSALPRPSSQFGLCD
ncbi:hypothetical protein [Mesorhizobium sp. M9A.F.Ca.ET.002.03.1.2]|uniref:hypothetical protein n=1 Tax=Mesorhizobium sp. M9A.F.Ca.ET.002.03.1.2 TaxID=2493668 RepID=UPI001FE11684|nr:hypothetical protein [Mesorhizobium sp. M9A.F.Ca.ET.002.03.1.2]